MRSGWSSARISAGWSMHKPADLIAAATSVISTTAAAAADTTGTTEPVLAAGIVGHALPSNVEMATAGAAADSLPDGGSGLVNAMENVVAMSAVQTADAERDGLTVRMLLAVTATRIYALDWTTGTGPTRILATLGRETTDVSVQRFGLSRRLGLVDHATGKELHLTATTAVFSPEAAGDKAVLDLLDQQG